MKIRSIIVDDEMPNRQNLTRLLGKYCPDIEIVGQAENSESAILAIHNLNPDLIFLDIRMPGGNAFEMLEQLPRNGFEVIFITAYDEYAFRAFEFNALDYLLKPLNFKKLISAVEKAKSKISIKEENHRLRNLVSNLERDYRDQKIALPNEEKTEFIAVRDIIRCQADSNYTRFFLLNGNSIIVSKTLKEYELALEEHNFHRVHNSHLVNLDHVRAYSRKDGGCLEMIDRSCIPISRTRREAVKELLIK
jgi:two-component system LytT family response regulator